MDLFYEAVVQHADGGLEILVIHTENDVQFVGALIDHTDVDARFTEGGEDLTGNTGAESHLPANGGDNGDLIVDIQRIRLRFLLDFRQNAYRWGATASVGRTTDTLSMPLGT